jgi:hypothetical protein
MVSMTPYAYSPLSSSTNIRLLQLNLGDGDDQFEGGAGPHGIPSRDHL